MAVTVRLFGYNTVAPSMQERFMPEGAPAQLMPEEPPLWSTIAKSDGDNPVSVSFPGPGTDTARVLGVEIEEGHAIRYELQPLGPSAPNVRIAGNQSRRVSGFRYFVWAAGSTFSFVDADALP